MTYSSSKLIQTILLTSGLFLFSACGGDGEADTSCYKVATYITSDPDAGLSIRTSYTYDTNRYLTEERYDEYMDGTDELITGYTYDSHGNLIEKRRTGVGIDGQIIDTYTNIYDINGNLAEVRIDRNSDAILDNIYLYNIYGDPVEEGKDLDGDGTIETINTYTNTYDRNGDLIEVKIDLGSTGTPNEIRTYDSYKNLIKVEHDWDGDGTPDRIFGYDYDTHHKLTREKFDMDGNGTYDEIDTYVNSYDRNGNLTEVRVDMASDGINDAINSYTYQKFENCISE